MLVIPIGRASWTEVMTVGSPRTVTHPVKKIYVCTTDPKGHLKGHLALFFSLQFFFNFLRFFVLSYT